jgi:IS1 family transposase
VSQDRPSRFVVAWAAGPRTADLAERVVQTTRARTAGQAGIPWISDGWEAYAEVVGAVSCDPVPAGTGDRAWSILHPTPAVRLTQAVKHRRGRRLARIEVRATIGAAAAQPYTVHIERLNGVLRDRLACLTRKTHAFAKDPTMWDAAVGLALFAHNWLRYHPALRVLLAAPAARRYHRRTPAMVLDLTDHRWSFVQFLTRPVPHYAWG